ncbi:MAG: hypothetical protein AB1736_05855 [Chloroflexota bacterium]
MTEPLSGWAARHLTLDALKAMQLAFTSGGAGALEAEILAIAEAAGVGAPEVVRAIAMAQNAGTAIVRTYAKMVSNSIVTSGLKASLSAAATAGGAAAGGAAAGEALTATGGAAAGEALTAAGATTGGATTTTTAGGLLAQLGALSVAAKLAVAAAVVAVVYVGAGIAGSLSGDAPIEPAPGVSAEPRSEEQRASDALAEGSARASEGDLQKSRRVRRGRGDEPRESRPVRPSGGGHRRP